jgi:hypothetical protein
MSDTNRGMAQKGIVSLSLFEKMQGHISDYRNGGSQTEAGAESGN